MEMNSTSLKRTARIGGLLYFFLFITGIYGIMYIPSKIVVSGDYVATAENILSNEFLFRSGFLNDIISNTIFLILALVLYRLLKHVDENKAKLMLVLVLVQIPVVFIMEALNITTLMILKGELLKTFELTQRQELAMLFYKINENGSVILEMFWGLWLLPLGLLVYKSKFIPRVIGILVFIAGIAYMVGSTIALLFPSLSSYIQQPILLLVALGEISIMLWLLIKGVKTQE